MASLVKDKIKTYFSHYKKEITIFSLNAIGIIFLGYFIFKIALYTFSQIYYKHPLKNYILTSKMCYRLSTSLSQNTNLKEYLNTQKIHALKSFLKQFLLPGDNFRIEVFNQNLVKLIDLPSSTLGGNGIFKVIKDPYLAKILSAGIGAYFLKPGEYGFELSGISPVYFQDQIIGLIEVKEIYDKPILLPKVYKTYIKYAPVKEVGNFILLNANYSKDFVKELLKKRALYKDAKYYILKPYNDYYFIFTLDLHKFLLVFIPSYLVFSFLYLILVWKYTFAKRVEGLNPLEISHKLKFIPHVIFETNGQILAINKEKWKDYLGDIDEIDDILSFLKFLNPKNPLDFYEQYFKNVDMYHEISLKLKNKYIKLKILPLSSNLILLLLDDLTSFYQRIKNLKEEKDKLEDLLNDLKLLLKAKNNKIAELKLQLYFLKNRGKNKENEKNEE